MGEHWLVNFDFGLAVYHCVVLEGLVPWQTRRVLLPFLEELRGGLPVIIDLLLVAFLDKWITDVVQVHPIFVGQSAERVEGSLCICITLLATEDEINPAIKRRGHVGRLKGLSEIGDHLIWIILTPGW